MRLCLPLTIVALCVCGCGRSESDYKPSPTAARDTLTAGLTAWQEGKPAGDLPPAGKGQPQVHFVDYQWSAGKRLASFKMLDETPALDGSTQMFRVELELAGEKPQEAKYYVVGIDPLWVMRDRDYEQTSMQ